MTFMSVHCFLKPFGCFDQVFLPYFRNKFPCLYPRRPNTDGAQELGGALVKCDKLMKRKLLTSTRSSSSSFSKEPGCPSRPKRQRTISSDDLDTDPESQARKRKFNYLTQFHSVGGFKDGGSAQNHAHPRRIVFREGINNVEFYSMVCTRPNKDLSCHLKRNKFGDYDLAASE